MKMEQAMQIIDDDTLEDEKGFLVCFEQVVGISRIILMSDYFPEVLQGESPIPTEEQAWELALKFADKMKNRVYNIHVICSDFSRSKLYRDKVLLCLWQNNE